MKRVLILGAALLAGSCDAVPADSDGTLDRIRGESRFRVGLIASTAPLAPERTRALLQRLSRATKASAVVETGAAEPMLVSLEEGGIDLVVGEFAKQSPWAARVTLTEPIAGQPGGQTHTVLAAAARNGENAWISMVFREARAVAQGAR
jgi:hypothetical protein